MTQYQRTNEKQNKTNKKPTNPHVRKHEKPANNVSDVPFWHFHNQTPLHNSKANKVLLPENNSWSLGHQEVLKAFPVTFTETLYWRLALRYCSSYCKSIQTKTIVKFHYTNSISFNKNTLHENKSLWGEKKRKRICLCHTYLNDGNIKKKKKQENTTEFQIQLEMPMSSKAQDCVYSLYFKKQCNTICDNNATCIKGKLIA